ncbi:MAG: energy transducer TonB [candidate division WOR-3 bacterium]|nr:energy transducer TonB [candidate division WOR-3 bacterium]
MNQQGEGTLQNRRLFGLIPKSSKALVIALMITIVLITILMLSKHGRGKNVRQEHQEPQVIEPDTYKYHEVDEKPELLSIPKALYPKGQHGEFCDIVVEVLIDTSGDVLNARILKTAGTILDEPALEAARKAKFRPAKHDGKPVRVWIAIPIIFTLQ